MKKPNRIQVIIAAVAMAIAVAVPMAIAQSTDTSGSAQKERRAHGRGRGERGGNRMMGRMFSRLDLTDAQKAQLKQIRENRRQSLTPLLTEIRTKRQEIRRSNQGGTFDEALVKQKLTEIAPLQAKLIGERFKLRQEMFSVLTPEQKTKLEQMREQFKSRRAERGSRKAL